MFNFLKGSSTPTISSVARLSGSGLSDYIHVKIFRLVSAEANNPALHITRQCSKNVALLLHVAFPLLPIEIRCYGKHDCGMFPHVAGAVPPFLRPSTPDKSCRDNPGCPGAIRCYHRFPDSVQYQTCPATPLLCKRTDKTAQT